MTIRDNTMRNLITLVTALFLPVSALAQKEGLSVELNTLDQSDSGCQLTFLVTTSFQTGIDQLVFETVLFDVAGGVDRLTLFDLGAIPAGKPRVRQFVMPDLQCSDLGKVLINGIPTCTAPGRDAGSCADALTVISRTDVEILG